MACRTARVVTLIYTSRLASPKGVEMTRQPAVRGYAIDECSVRFGDQVTSATIGAHRRSDDRAGCECSAQVAAVADARTIAAAPTTQPWGPFPRFGKSKAGIEFTVAHGTDEMKRQALAWAMSVAGKRANAPLLWGESMSDQLVAEWAKPTSWCPSCADAGLRRAAVGPCQTAPIPKETLFFATRYRHPNRRDLGECGAELRCHRHTSRDGRRAPSENYFPGCGQDRRRR